MAIPNLRSIILHVRSNAHNAIHLDPRLDGDSVHRLIDLADLDAVVDELTYDLTWWLIVDRAVEGEAGGCSAKGREDGDGGDEEFHFGFGFGWDDGVNGVPKRRMKGVRCGWLAGPCTGVTTLSEDWLTWHVLHRGPPHADLLEVRHHV